ncbi:DUF3127 domain-containing protein [Fluviicola sp.]|jgi:hypothetical protein|uniref:DUF3127 domain-containing protein n=1 Tax=Fluviicola sp. TaxID=1917219 RepID=UPI00282510CB|nr:DUF3127 domain-containing protein [Fluviicola sp.]MDR0803426.1 DUF3127 domain-containing protein [Fluviicola sp.]
MFKISGILKVKNDTVQVSEKFSKREFVLTDNASMYPQDILFQLTQDKCSLIDGFNLQDQIEVSFNLRGREWTNPQGEVRYFNTLEAWRIERVGAASSMSGGIPAGGPTAMNLDPVASASSASTAPSDDDDLPF